MKERKNYKVKVANVKLFIMIVNLISQILKIKLSKCWEIFINKI